MVVSLITTVRNKFLEAIRSVQPQGRWKILVVDLHSQKLLNSVLKRFDILEENVTDIQLITNPRDPQPEFEAMYILMPTSQNVDRVIRDFSNRQQYMAAHLFFIDGLSEELFQRLTSSPAEPYLQACKELFLNLWGAFILLFWWREWTVDGDRVVATEAQTFALNEPGLFFSLYSPPRTEAAYKAAKDRLEEDLIYDTYPTATYLRSPLQTSHNSGIGGIGMGLLARDDSDSGSDDDNDNDEAFECRRKAEQAKCNAQENSGAEVGGANSANGTSKTAALPAAINANAHPHLRPHPSPHSSPKPISSPHPGYAEPTIATESLLSVSSLQDPASADTEMGTCKTRSVTATSLNLNPKAALPSIIPHSKSTAKMPQPSHFPQPHRQDTGQRFRETQSKLDHRQGGLSMPTHPHLQPLFLKLPLSYPNPSQVPAKATLRPPSRLPTPSLPPRKLKDISGTLFGDDHRPHSESRLPFDNRSSMPTRQRTGASPDSWCPRPRTLPQPHRQDSEHSMISGSIPRVLRTLSRSPSFLSSPLNNDHRKVKADQPRTKPLRRTNVPCPTHTPLITTMPVSTIPNPLHHSRQETGHRMGPLNKCFVS
ncbi:hypothetical protein NMY22_g12882 [Coprinellus aureogranulatus]|nr:hypothetical protein NMY22_g12882 [Coprinellus aureogranulatus]